MITLRLNNDLEQRIDKTAKNFGITKSELIRQSISEYLNRIKQPDSWEIGKDLFGKYSSGRGNLSVKRKELVKKKITAKRK